MRTAIFIAEYTDPLRSWSSHSISGGKTKSKHDKKQNV